MRNARNVFVSLCAGLLLICLFGAPQASAGRQLNTGITVPDAGLVGQIGYDRIKDAGANFTRVTLFWSVVAPKAEPADWDPTDPADPNYDWSSVDHQVVNAINAGLSPMVQIYQAPGWAERCSAPDEPGTCDPDPDDFRKFTVAAVKRYSGDFDGLPKVSYWEPWNEPNLSIFFKPQRKGNQHPSAALYRTLLNRFAAVVKASDPTNKVVGGGLAPLGGQTSTGPLDFTRRVLCMEGRRKPKPRRGCNATATFDIWAVNPYTTGGPTQSAISPDDVQLGDVGEMVDLIRAASKAKKIKSDSSHVPVWITEFSWDSKPPDPNGLKMSILSRWASEALYRAWKAGVENFFWLSLRDWARIDGHPFNSSIESGLWFRGETIEQDRPKQVLKAFSYPFVAFRSSRGITVWGRTPMSEPGRVAIKFGKGRSSVNRRVKTLTADRYGIFKSFIRTSLGSNKRGYMTATFSGQTSLPFSLKPVKNFRQKPFG